MMIFKSIFYSFFILVFFIGCSSDEHKEEQHHEKEHIHWGYTGKGAPEHWGALKPEFAMCSKGKMQTPINIIPTKDVRLRPLHFDYQAPATTIINNGHSIQVNVAPGSTLRVNGVTYELKQFHFHTPSENHVVNHEFALEAHFVHATHNGDLAVVAVMFEEGRENRALQKIWSHFPKQKNKEIPINLSEREIFSLMPRIKDYFTFMGSLTTPPCSENVKWIVLKTPMSISSEQVHKFFRVFGHPNNRPIQPTNNRVIYE